jgi:glycine C-acetyltransferase
MPIFDDLSTQLAILKEQGLYKHEHVINSPQNAHIHLKEESSPADILNFCANNYLGLANHPKLKEAAHEAIDKYGYGMASVRFICGTQTPHKLLEKKISNFLGFEDTILYSSCFDANTGLFETILGPDDAIISDALNHASIIDGVRLCKAKRFVYKNNDMTDLEERLKEAKNCRYRLIATDGVFSMDGIIANLPDICALAEKYDALVMVDDSHALGVIGPQGKGTPAYYGLADKVDIVTGTFGKALGGASGGFTASHKSIIDWLRQRSRPYLFSNTLCPIIAHTSLTAFHLLETTPLLLQQLHQNTTLFRQKMTEYGFDLGRSKDHPIVPVMIGDAVKAQKMSESLLKDGIYVVGFSFPVVPKDQARIRVQISASHTSTDIEHVAKSFHTAR